MFILQCFSFSPVEEDQQSGPVRGLRFDYNIPSEEGGGNLLLFMCQPFTSGDQAPIVLTMNEGLGLINYIFTHTKTPVPPPKKKKQPQTKPQATKQHGTNQFLLRKKAQVCTSRVIAHWIETRWTL